MLKERTPIAFALKDPINAYGKDSDEEKSDVGTSSKTQELF